MYTPPHVGFYKLEIYASRVPKTTGKINLPLVATFMLEVCEDDFLKIFETCMLGVCEDNFLKIFSKIQIFETIYATQVRLKGYGDKMSQESSFQNRRGTQEMQMSAERRLSRFLKSLLGVIFSMNFLCHEVPLHTSM